MRRPYVGLGGPRSNRSLVAANAGAASSARGARLLRERGFPEVYALFDGWQAWLDAGYPTESAVGGDSSSAPLD